MSHGKSLWDTGFSLQDVYTSGNDQRRIAGEILKNGLAEVNPQFQLALVEQPWPVFLKATNSGQLPLFMLGWHQDFNDPHNGVTPYMASGGTYASAQPFDPEL